MQLSTKEAIKLIHKLELEIIECKHHVRGFLVLNGRRIFPVHCSFGHKDLPGHVPHLFRKSLMLSVEEFETLRSCRLDRNSYLDLLKQKGVIE
jgi:hypothetical protein